MSRLVTLYCLGLAAFQPVSIAGAQLELSDSLLQEMEDLPDGTDKLKKILDASQYFFRKNLEKYRHYSEEGLRIAKRLSIDSFELIFLTELAQGLVRTNEANEAFQFVDEGLNLAKRLGNEQALSKLYQNEAFAHYSQSNYTAAIKSLLAALDHSSDLSERARIQNNLGNLFQKIEDPEKALQYFEDAFNFHHENQDTGLMGSSLGNMGVALFDLRKYDEALSKLRLSLKYARSVYDSISICIRLENIANVFKNTVDSDSAWYYYNEARDVALQLKDTAGLASIYQNMAEFISFKLDRPVYALPYMTSAYRLAKTIDDPYLIQVTQRALSDIYWQTGDFKLSREYLNAYIDLKDSLARINREEVIRDLEIKYQAAEKERQIQAQELALYKTRNQRNIFLGLAGIGLFLIVSITYFLARQIKLTRKIHEQRAILSEQELIKVRQEQKNLALRSMLEGEDSERKRLAKELHDGLGGLLSTIKLSFSKTWSRSEGDRNRATLLIDKAHGELRRIAHNLMPGTLLKYGLISAVEELCDEINYTGHLKVTFQHFDVKGPMPDHFSFQIYRILQELLQNVIKHADAREVLVQLIQRNEQLILTVEDDGKGLPDDFDRKAGLGMNNLQSRVNLLNATIQSETKKGEGTTFTITIPKKDLHD